MGDKSSSDLLKYKTNPQLKRYSGTGRHQLAMRHLVLSMMVAVASAGPQIAFGGGRTTTGAPTTKAPSDVNTRLGLLAGSLGLDPVAGSGNSGSGSGVSQAFTDGQSQPSGRKTPCSFSVAGSPIILEG